MFWAGSKGNTQCCPHKYRSETERKSILWTGLCTLGSDCTQANPSFDQWITLTLLEKGYYIPSLMLHRALEGQPSFTLHVRDSQYKAIPAVKQTSTCKAYHAEIFSQHVLVPATLAGTQKLRYRKGGRKGKNFYRIFSSYILERIHANFSFVQELHLSWSSILSLAPSVFYPAPIKMMGVYHPLNSVLQAKPLMRLQNKSNTWLIYCKPPLWIFSLSWLSMSWTVKSCCIFSVISCQSGGWKTKLISTLTNYFSNFAEVCEEFEPTHTSILDHLKKWVMGWLCPSIHDRGLQQYNRITLLQRSCFLPFTFQASQMVSQLSDEELIIWKQFIKTIFILE